jgi:hypothetical protein
MNEEEKRLEEEKGLLDGYRRLSPRSRYVALAQIIAGAEMEENARRMIQHAIGQKNGFAGLDAPLFKGQRAVSGPAAKEVANG